MSRTFRRKNAERYVKALQHKAEERNNPKAAVAYSHSDMLTRKGCWLDWYSRKPCRIIKEITKKKLRSEIHSKPLVAFLKEDFDMNAKATIKSCMDYYMYW